LKFLLNMNTLHQLGKRLQTQGHSYRHVGDIGMACATDAAIMQAAQMNDEVIITHDLDYGNLLAFSGEAAPSVIIYRVRNTHPENLFARIVKIWAEIEKPLLDGAIVVIEDAALRIRPLPIARDE